MQRYAEGSCAWPQIANCCCLGRWCPYGKARAISNGFALLRDGAKIPAAGLGSSLRCVITWSRECLGQMFRDRGIPCPPRLSVKAGIPVHQPGLASARSQSNRRCYRCTHPITCRTLPNEPSWQPVRLTGGRARRQSRRPKCGGTGMRTWLEYDLVAMAALVLGVAAVELLAFIVGG